MNTFLWYVFFIHANKLELLSLLFLLFPYFHFWFFVSSSQHFVFVPALCFLLEYLMQHLKALKNSQVSNDYNSITIVTNHVSRCYKKKKILLLFHYPLDCPWIQCWCLNRTIYCLFICIIISPSVYKSILLLLQYSLGRPSTYCYFFE